MLGQPYRQLGGRPQQTQVNQRADLNLVEPFAIAALCGVISPKTDFDELPLARLPTSKLFPD
jgi:hypothetical protein